VSPATSVLTERHVSFSVQKQMRTHFSAGPTHLPSLLSLSFSFFIFLISTPFRPLRRPGVVGYRLLCTAHRVHILDRPSDPGRLLSNNHTPDFCTTDTYSDSRVAMTSPDFPAKPPRMASPLAPATPVLGVLHLWSH
jgi:hypothetical protein